MNIAEWSLEERRKFGSRGKTINGSQSIVRSNDRDVRIKKPSRGRQNVHWALTSLVIALYMVKAVLLKVITHYKLILLIVTLIVSLIAGDYLSTADFLGGSGRALDHYIQKNARDIVTHLINELSLL